MKNKFLFLLLVCISHLSYASKDSDIAALVNSQPITNYEFQARKKMLYVLNNISKPTAEIEKQISQGAINSLIEEALISQHAKKISAPSVTDEQINESIAQLEERNKMPKAFLIKYLENNQVDVQSFKANVTSELIKMKILSSLSQSVTISSKEIESVIIYNSSKDIEIDAKLFTSKDLESKSLKSMATLKKQLKTCDNINENSFKNFATIEHIKQSLKDLDSLSTTLVKDLDNDQTSSIVQTNGHFKFALLCNKKIIVTPDENNYVINFLSNKKLSQKAQKFFNDMRKKAYVKIFIKI